MYLSCRATKKDMRKITDPSSREGADGMMDQRLKEI